MGASAPSNREDDLAQIREGFLSLLRLSLKSAILSSNFDAASALKAYRLSLPALVVITFGVLLPFLVIGDFSLRETVPDGPHTLANFRRIVSDPYLLSTTLTTVSLAGTVTLACLIFGYPLAVFLARSNSALKPVLLFSLVAPLLVSIVLRTIGWTILLGNVGLVNNILLSFGLIDSPLRLLGNFWSVTLAMTHVLLPFMVLSVSAVLAKLDPSIEEAAKMLGAGRFHVFWNVTFPLSLSGVAAGSVIVFCLTLGSYVTPAWLGRGQVQVLPITVYQQMVIYIDWPNGTAAALLLAGIALFASLVASIWLKRGDQ